MMTDPIADMIARMRNAAMRHYPDVIVPASKIKKNILDVLIREGYIKTYTVEHNQEGPGENIRIQLKYQFVHAQKRPVITKMRRVSRCGKHQYISAAKIRPVDNGLGNMILSTSQGVLSDKEARAQHVGGKILLTVR